MRIVEYSPVASAQLSSSPVFWAVMELLALGGCLLGVQKLRVAREAPNGQRDVSRIQTGLIILMGWMLISAVRLIMQI
jgi:hypothetical protein